MTLGNRYLRPGENLRIDVRDINLAGYYNTVRNGLDNTRILNANSPPSMVVSYTLTGKGACLRRAIR